VDLASKKKNIGKRALPKQGSFAKEVGQCVVSLLKDNACL